MNIPTCYRCPERHPVKWDDRKRCSILQGKLDAVKGAGLTSISFKCEKRPALFQPGEVVEFEIYSRLGDVMESPPQFKCRGIVMRTKGRKVLVFVDAVLNYPEEETERPIMSLYPDGFTKTGERYPVCIHCGKPKDRDIALTNKDDGHEKEWMCRDNADPETGLLIDQTSLPCVFGNDDAEAVVAEKGDLW